MTLERALPRPVSFSLCLLAAAVMAACGGGATEEPTASAESETVSEALVAQSMDTDPNAASVDDLADNFAAATNPDPTMRAQSLVTGFVDSSAVFINSSLIPLGSAGSSVDIMSSTTELPAPSEGGAFRTVCKYSHMASDDPIVFPNQPGRSHLHTFFGNTGTNASSTASSLLTSGNSTCRGGTVNRTAYWVPSMIDTRTGTPLKPSDSHFYYKTGNKAIEPSSVRPMPEGLRMIAGDPKNAAPVGPFYYNCKGGPNVKQIPNCAVGTELYQNIRFPQCWDGVNLDSPDHKSHMAYQANGVCPSTHPVILPEVTFRIIYAVTEADAPLHWRLSSDAYDRSLPAGYSSHGDWFNGWKRDISNSWATNCIAASKDCHSHLLGDGRKISF